MNESQRRRIHGPLRPMHEPPKRPIWLLLVITAVFLTFLYLVN